MQDSIRSFALLGLLFSGVPSSGVEQEQNLVILAEEPRGQGTVHLCFEVVS